jgi:steroid 5-alpha reductase family enzyme
MNHWLWVAVVIEATALASWIAAAATRQTKVTFVFGFNLMAPVAGLHLAASGEFGWRAAVAAVSVALYLANMNVVILLWTKNTALPKLDRVLGPLERHALPLVMANGVGWLYCLPFYFIGRRAAGPPNWLDALAVVAYVVGTGIHFAADSQKRRFKASPGTKGRLLDQGLWRYSRHPNYFGDFLAYVSWALFAANPWAWLSPAANLAQYALDAIPKSEAWAAERYGAAWSDYAAHTSRFFPWVPSHPRRAADET